MKFTNTLQYCTFDGPLGPMTLAAQGHALAGVWFDGQQHQPDSTHWTFTTGHTVLQRAALQLQEYFSGQRSVFELPLDLNFGTAFQQQVWQALLGIPSGATTSYGAISQQIGNPRAVRAVGSAIGRNPLSIVVPCHRVLGARGALTGYAGGLERKIALLELERTH